MHLCGNLIHIVRQIRSCCFGLFSFELYLGIFIILISVSSVVFESVFEGPAKTCTSNVSNFVKFCIATWFFDAIIFGSVVYHTCLENLKFWNLGPLGTQNFRLELREWIPNWSNLELQKILISPLQKWPFDSQNLIYKSNKLAPWDFCSPKTCFKLGKKRH